MTQIKKKNGSRNPTVGLKFKVAPQFCKAGSGSALRKIAGFGSAKNDNGSTALIFVSMVSQLVQEVLSSGHSNILNPT